VARHQSGTKKFLPLSGLKKIGGGERDRGVARQMERGSRKVLNGIVRGGEVDFKVNQPGAGNCLSVKWD